MKIALLQMDTTHNREENAAALLELCERAKSADILISPECTNLRTLRLSKDVIYDQDSDPLIQTAREWCRANAKALILGSVFVRDEANERMFNRQIFIEASGEVLAQYDKIHMFDVELPNGEKYLESDRFVSGAEAVVTDYHGVKIGHSICYDIRFPLLYRKLAQRGAEVIIAPAAFTESTGRAHWKSLMRARAIETGAYGLASAQCGKFENSDGTIRANWGHSMAVSPWGEVIVEMGDTVGVEMVDIHLERVRAARAQIPAWNSNQEFEVKTYGK